MNRRSAKIWLLPEAHLQGARGNIGYIDKALGCEFIFVCAREFLGLMAVPDTKDLRSERARLRTLRETDRFIEPQLLRA
jgi:hypothetical protein